MRMSKQIHEYTRKWILINSSKLFSRVPSAVLLMACAARTKNMSGIYRIKCRLDRKKCIMAPPQRMRCWQRNKTQIEYTNVIKCIQVPCIFYVVRSKRTQILLPCSLFPQCLSLAALEILRHGVMTLAQAGVSSSIGLVLAPVTSVSSQDFGLSHDRSICFFFFISSFRGRSLAKETVNIGMQRRKDVIVPTDQNTTNFHRNFTGEVTPVASNPW